MTGPHYTVKILTFTESTRLHIAERVEAAMGAPPRADRFAGFTNPDGTRIPIVTDPYRVVAKDRP